MPDELDAMLTSGYETPGTPGRGRLKHPDGWTPGIDTARREVVATTESADAPDWGHVLSALGVEGKGFQVDGDTVQIRSWDVPGHGTMYYHRATLRTPQLPDEDVGRLLKLASSARPRIRKDPPESGGRSLVVCVADWQAGQLRGEGLEGLVERVHRLRAGMEQRWKTLNRDTPLERLVILCLGDLVEACDGHYPMQTAQTVDMRTQTRLVRRLLYGLVDTAAKIAPAVTLAAVPGNHGEKRKDGKVFTSWDDNLDVEIPEQVGDICAANEGRFGHVKIALPQSADLTLTLDVSGTVVGAAHGHQFRKGGTDIRQKVEHWWAHKAKHRTPIGDCDVLVSGHYHHLRVWEEGVEGGGTRTWFQCPSLDNGSPWWEHMAGAPTRTGTLTFVAGGGGWDRLEVIR